MQADKITETRKLYHPLLFGLDTMAKADSKISQQSNESHFVYEGYFCFGDTETLSELELQYFYVVLKVMLISDRHKRRLYL